jgi:oligopeptide/dipeptide ABC transporter ATP-binding protein
VDVTGAPLLEVSGLTVEFRSRGIPLVRRAGATRAVDEVSFSIAPGTTLGLVGESGSGKSTTASVLLGLHRPTAGTVRLGRHDYTTFRRGLPRAVRRDIQAVFQNPGSSLDPTRSIGDAVGEPVRLHLGLRGDAKRRRVRELLELVGISERLLASRPGELSGGQQQRVAIARALAGRARLIVCDEPVASLDVSTQAQVINLFAEVQRELGVAYLFIGHDLDVVAHVSDRLAVMYRGRIVESGAVERVYRAPQHPYTEQLLRATPVADPARQRQRRLERRAAPAAPQVAPAAASAAGCAFQDRCALVQPQCRDVLPPLRPAEGGGLVACHAAPQPGELPRAAPAERS